MTYQETVNWMFKQLPMYQQMGETALNAKLDNILSLSSHLGDPHNKFKSIHVAGTNGKGSSTHMLASVLQEAGYKVGLYTSPHLKDYRERIKINGETIDKQAVIKFVADNKPFFEQRGLSFFEMSVGLAFYYFALKEVDIAVIEVGLGGRLDATNIISPEVALITNIGMDHTDMLGESLLEITREKGGIIKKGVPVVISEYQEELADEFRSIAKRQDAEIVFAEHEIAEDYETSLLGNYQAKNVKGVIACLRMLKGFEINKEDIKAGLLNVVQNTGLMGRWQILQTQPKVICDTAHNSEGLSLVLEQLSQQQFKSLHIVLGLVKNKDLDKILPLFPKGAQYYFSSPAVPRGLSSDTLKNAANSYGLEGAVYDSVPRALEIALSNAGKEDLVFVGGSTFTVAEVV
ncbi:bifunctional folylpolyglutamate synthase/dihydrofolate synthase [Muriicola sp. Z0-33]|uniref:bifunctional folylpolyglutamate synthase/dihydrofolate synthase n=1 Tax=Muriicola sp. Z0-33 TaxID=2816957 RepID=UPI00223857EA|nr:folylpolyglutamate synthase/dihydrofolate synthase family protein [Muriicola sp. Z0-33]MCW5517943.1 bifunctional folylpolyglutamate synthase/dihydrofolate synthase [Muriicola sp. Z0-33]